MRSRAEWEPLKDVMMHRPSIEIEYAMLAPKPFLFERVFSFRDAIREHESLEKILKDNGVNVLLLENELIKKADSSNEFRKKLEEKVLSLVNFYGTKEEVQKAKEELILNIEKIDSKTLVDYLILEPSINLKNDLQNNSEYPTVYSNIPLANLYFMRDQQAVADNGLIVGNMKRQQRSKEPEITEFTFRHVLNYHNPFKVTGSGYFEGGDFMPAGEFALIGIGNRTNMDGALQAMSSGKLEFDEVGVVENQIYDFMGNDYMVNMHLDTYFNLPADGIAVTSKILAKKSKLHLYGRVSKGEYEFSEAMTLEEYLKAKGFNIIDLNPAEQLSYASNFLTVKDSRIIAVNTPTVLRRLINEKIFDPKTLQIVQEEFRKAGEEGIFPHRKVLIDFGIEVIEAELSELTGGYGGAHCMTAALNRG